VLVWLGASVVVFALVRLTPGDPVLTLLPPSASAADVESYRRVLGLDQPAALQYAAFLSRLVSGDFGTSFVYRKPVLTLMTTALPVTLQVVGAGFAIALVVAVPLGLLAAQRAGTVADGVINLLLIVGQSVPTYWLGILLIVVFAVGLRLLPTSGAGTPAHVVLPAVSIAAWVAAVIAAVTRETLVDVLRQPYIATARAKGLGRRAVLWRHAFRNASIQIVTVVALEFGYLLSGAVITEVVFGLPGIGSLGYAAILQRDYPLVQGIVLWAAAGLLLLNLLLDLAYAYLDPRIRYG
jgi:ABC-type dipeptide/oligopeptide/nickel transport system permease component